jgi:response regulator of citrate/malate metabolism
MKNNEISNEVRFQVLWEANIRTIPTLLKYVKISSATAKRWAKQMAEKGYIERKEGTGGHNATPKKVERKVIKKVKETKKPLNTRSLGNSTGVSRETARRILQNNNRKFKKLKKKKLTENQKKERKSFVNHC